MHVTASTHVYDSHHRLMDEWNKLLLQFKLQAAMVGPLESLHVGVNAAAVYLLEVDWHGMLLRYAFAQLNVTSCLVGHPVASRWLNFGI